MSFLIFHRSFIDPAIGPAVRHALSTSPRHRLNFLRVPRASAEHRVCSTDELLVRPPYLLPSIFSYIIIITPRASARPAGKSIRLHVCCSLEFDLPSSRMTTTFPTMFHKTVRCIVHCSVQIIMKRRDFNGPRSGQRSQVVDKTTHRRASRPFRHRSRLTFTNPVTVREFGVNRASDTISSFQCYYLSLFRVDFQRRKYTERNVTFSDRFFVDCTDGVYAVTCNSYWFTRCYSIGESCQRFKD